MFYVDLSKEYYGTHDDLAIRVRADSRKVIERMIDAWYRKLSGSLSFVLSNDFSAVEIALSESVVLVVVHVGEREYEGRSSNE